MDFAFNAEEMQDERLRCHVLFARYMRVTPEEVERMPVRTRNRYLRLLAETIKAENKPGVPTEDG